MSSLPSLPSHLAAMRAPAVAAAIALCLLLPGSARAQEPAAPAAPATPPARSVAWRADSIALAGDSLRALAMLDTAVRANRRDAEAWHRRGMILWAMARSHRSGGFIKDSKAIKRLIDADSSLRLARQLAPDTARYAVELGRFFLNSSLVTLRWQAMGVFEKGLDAAERAGSPWQVAEAADELAMTHWRRYEPVARRGLTAAGSASPSSDDLDAMGNNANTPRELLDFVETQVREVEGSDFMGRAEYERSLDLFARALAAFPDHPRARRHYYMALAERDRWEELASVTTQRLQGAPWDATTHLARGLALHRGGKGALAQAAFDSALALLTDEERVRLTDVTRLLRTSPRARGEPSDSALYASQSLAARLAGDSIYWQVSDPMSLTPENEHRNEFLARVAYADLRWTSDDLDRRGADTDRGEVWVRWGPPRRRFTTAGKDASTASETWIYPDGLAFTFITPPTWGTGRYSQSSYARAQEAKAVKPASWANVPINRRIDSILVQTARFRGVGDSADFVLVAEFPIDSLFRGLDVARAPLDMGMGVWTGPSLVLLRDSTRVAVDLRDSINLPRLRTWRERLPHGDHVYRIEALQPDGMRGARALGKVRLGSMAGFGASDLLVATQVGARDGALPRRWRDLIVAPNAGRFSRGQPIGLVWETYGLQASPEGGTKYRVAVTLERRFDSKAASFVASVVSGVSGAPGLRAEERRGKTALRFERSGPASEVSVDWLTLDVGRAPAGRYLVTVEVTDLVANKATTTTRMVRIE